MIGDGFWTGVTAPGTQPCGCFASRRGATGGLFLLRFLRNCHGKCTILGGSVGRQHKAGESCAGAQIGGVGLERFCRLWRQRLAAKNVFGRCLGGSFSRNVRGESLVAVLRANWTV